MSKTKKIDAQTQWLATPVLDGIARADPWCMRKLVQVCWALGQAIDKNNICKTAAGLELLLIYIEKAIHGFTEMDLRVGGPEYMFQATVGFCRYSSSFSAKTSTSTVSTAIATAATATATTTAATGWKSLDEWFHDNPNVCLDQDITFLSFKNRLVQFNGCVYAVVDRDLQNQETGEIIQRQGDPPDKRSLLCALVLIRHVKWVSRLAKKTHMQLQWLRGRVTLEISCRPVKFVAADSIGYHDHLIGRALTKAEKITVNRVAPRGRPVPCIHVDGSYQYPKMERRQLLLTSLPVASRTIETLAPEEFFDNHLTIIPVSHSILCEQSEDVLYGYVCSDMRLLYFRQLQLTALVPWFHNFRVFEIYCPRHIFACKSSGNPLKSNRLCFVGIRQGQFFVALGWVGAPYCGLRLVFKPTIDFNDAVFAAALEKWVMQRASSVLCVCLCH